MHLGQGTGLDAGLGQGARLPAPAQASLDQPERSQVVVGAPVVAGKDEAWVGLRAVAAGNDDLARGGEMLLAQQRRGGLRQQRVVRCDDGNQHFAAHFLKTFAAIDAGALEHQRQLRTAGVQHGHGIGLRGGQHLHL